MTVNLELKFGLKFSVPGVCHKMIFGQVSSNYSDSSDNRIRKQEKYYFDYAKSNLYKLSLKNPFL